MRTDLELLHAWRGGDEHAGGELFDRHFDALYRFFGNKVGDGIDDLVQQTLLGCVQGRERFREDSSFRTYLFATARNVLYQHFDRRGRDAARIDYGTVSVIDLGESPSRVLDGRAEQRLLATALQRLPIDDQIALELRYWQGLTGPELVDVLGIPEPAVRSRLRRALERLRGLIAQLAASPAELDSITADLERWADSLRTPQA